VSDQRRLVLVGHSYLALENRKQLDALARHIEVHVLSPRSWHEGMSHFDLREGVAEGRNWRLHLMRQRRFPGLPQSQYVLPGAANVMRAVRPDLIHIESDPWTTVAIQIIATRNRQDRRVPIVSTAKQNTYTRRNWLFGTLKHQCGRWGVRNVARFIVISNAAASIYRQQFQVADNRMDFNTHLGVDTSLFAPPSQDERAETRSNWFSRTSSSRHFAVGYCGRLVEHKGVADLVQAVRRARKRASGDVQLLMLGDGPMRAELEHLANEEGFLHVLPRVPHAKVADFLKGLDLFVMPARRTPDHEEHDAHAVIEALSCGLPCIGTDSGVIREAMGGTGTVIPCSDIPALSEGILTEVAASTGKAGPRPNVAGRQWVEKTFSLAAVARKNAATYARALGEWKRGSASG